MMGLKDNIKNNIKDLEFDLVFETMLWSYELLNIDRLDRDKVSQRTLIHPTIF